MSNSDNSNSENSNSYVRNHWVDEHAWYSSESESENLWQQSVSPLTRTYIQRDRLTAGELLVQDYFAANPRFSEYQFERRFRMSRGLFLRIVTDLEATFDYFKTSFDAMMAQSFTSLQKCTSAIRQLAYGITPDALDEYLNMSERVSRESLYNFCYGIVQLYSNEYLRMPTSNDIELLYDFHESRHGFPGMLGSIDCTHWEWRSCPTALQGQYQTGNHQYPTIMLEAIASQDLWIWHAFFGVPGGNNDLNVLYSSPLFDEKFLGTAPNSSFLLNGEEYKHGYYLGDGIYQTWATIVKSYPHPISAKKLRFKNAQEAARKDVERAFGVLKSKWAIIKQPARPRNKDRCKDIMYACIIMHNMILKDQGDAICPEYDPSLPTEVEVDDDLVLELTNPGVHHRLRADLVDHIEHAYVPCLDR